MATPTTLLSIDDAASALQVDAGLLLQEIRDTAAAAERPSARD